MHGKNRVLLPLDHVASGEHQRENATRKYLAGVRRDVRLKSTNPFADVWLQCLEFLTFGWLLDQDELSVVASSTCSRTKLLDMC
jgi:hypothetical protein